MFVEYHYKCNYDKLWIVQNDAEPEKIFCGYTDQPTKMPKGDPRDYEVNAYYVRILLKSDNIIQKEGFSFSWSTAEMLEDVVEVVTEGETTEDVTTAVVMTEEITATTG